MQLFPPRNRMRIRSMGARDDRIDFGVAPASIERIEAPVTFKVRMNLKWHKSVTNMREGLPHVRLRRLRWNALRL